jgi:hypothetical protein
VTTRARPSHKRIPQRDGQRLRDRYGLSGRTSILDLFAWYGRSRANSSFVGVTPSRDRGGLERDCSHAGGRFGEIV